MNIYFKKATNLYYITVTGLLTFSLNGTASAHDIQGAGACGIEIKKAECTPKNNHENDQKFCSIVTPERASKHCQEHKKNFSDKFELLKNDQSNSLTALRNYSNSLVDWESSLTIYPKTLVPYQKKWQEWSVKSAACKSGSKSQCGPKSASTPDSAIIQTKTCKKFNLLFKNWGASVKNTDEFTLRQKYPLFEEYKATHQNASKIYNQNCTSYNNEVEEYLRFAEKHNASREQWITDMADWKAKVQALDY